MKILVNEEDKNYILDSINSGEVLNEDLRRWFKEKWVDVSRKVKGKYPPCGRKDANNKAYPKCRPSKKVSKETPKIASSFDKKEKKAMTSQKRREEKKHPKVGKGNKPTMVKFNENFNNMKNPIKIIITENQLKNILKENMNSKYIVYHGTENDIEEFGKNEIGTNTKNNWKLNGFYFSDNIKQSKTFGNIILKCEILLNNPIDLTQTKDSSVNGSGLIRLLGDLDGFSKVEIPQLKRTIGELDSIIRELEYYFNPDRIKYNEKNKTLNYDLNNKQSITINNIQPNEYENQDYIKALIIKQTLKDMYKINTMPIRIKDIMSPNTFTLIAKDNGYDGVIMDNSTAFSGYEYVAFDYDQITILEKMNKSKNIESEINEECWKGYKKKGYKIKNGKNVPNCVSINENQLKKILSENISVSENELKQIFKGYIEVAIWTEEERLNDEYSSEYGSEYNKVFKDYDDAFDDEDEEETELDKLVKISANMNNKGIEKFSKEDIEVDSLIKAYTDIKEFLNMVGDKIDIAIDENGFEELGHDIWLTRNRHGAGFFDRGYDDEDEKLFIDACHKLGEVDLYINDDMKLSFSNEHL
jgi:hypothetical protein